jgi:Transmembrane domain of unknown function (DUF3566)
LDRPTNTSDGSGGPSPAVVTARHDDDDLTAETDETSAILGTSSVRTATWSATATAGMEAPAKKDSAREASANGSSAASENGTGKDHAVADVPALPADSIGSARDSFTFGRPVSAPVSPVADDWTRGVAAPSAPDAGPISADNEPTQAESAVAETGTGVGTEPYGPSRAGSPAAQPSGSPEPSAVSAAAFAWDSPEPAPTSPSSPARSLLRESADPKTAPPPRTPPVSVNPPEAQAGQGGAPAAGARPRSKRSAKRSARQAHLTIARVEPWSVMKFSFVVSLVAFVILFVAVSVIYSTLSALGVFTSLQHVVQSVTSSQDSSGVNAARWFTESRVLSYTALLGALNIVLITAMCTIGAVVYNLTSRLIGGVEVTLRETE